MSRLTELTLQQFRNHAHLHLQFPHLTTVIVGNNGQGKTSILEAIQLLATGKSFRAEKVEEMIAFGQELARVKGKVEKNGQDGDDESESIELEALLTRGMVQGKKTVPTLYSVNTVRRRKREFVGHFLSVVFRPEDMRLIEGSPGRRRDFLDSPLTLYSQDYAHSLNTYEKTLQRRNKLLHQIREGEAPASTLTYWNLSLIKHGQIIQEHRRHLIEFCRKVEFPLRLGLEYDESVMSAERLAHYAHAEIAAGHTLVGPHKDDFMVTLEVEGEPRAIDAFGSRGQQRLAVLWLKLCELSFLQTELQQRPVLLLDDIFSELDDISRTKVLDIIRETQTIITTTEERVVTELEHHLPHVDEQRLQ